MAHLFAQRGAHVVLCDLDLSAAEKVAQDINSKFPGGATAKQLDVSKATDVEKVFADVASGGGINIREVREQQASEAITLRLLHQTGNEFHVTSQAIKLCNAEDRLATFLTSVGRLASTCSRGKYDVSSHTNFSSAGDPKSIHLHGATGVDLFHLWSTARAAKPCDISDLVKPPCPANNSRAPAAPSLGLRNSTCS